MSRSFARVLGWGAGAVALSLACMGASAGTVTVITSFPKELTQAYKTAFEKANPGIKLEILNKHTVAGIAYVRELPAGQRPDVFWASAPDAFEVLKRDKLLAQLPNAANADIPSKIGNYPVNDPAGFYKGQALAGYGIMYNTRYLKAHKLAAPREWEDLNRPEWFGHVGITSPSRSGTMHLTVETILQGEGWDRGWGTLLRMAGNSAAVTERSFGVPDGINNGQFGAGPVIDFFGLAGKYSGFPVEFIYPAVTAIVPANIGLIAGAKNADEGRKFVQFTLGKEGQQLLLNPKISRLPVMSYASLAGKIPPGYPDPVEIAKRSKVHFDSTLSQQRYYVVHSLFDQTITFRLKDLQEATRAILDAERKLAAKPNAQASELLKQARALAYSPLVGGKLAGDADFLALFAKNKQDAAVNKQVTGLEDNWSTKSQANYQKARELARQAGALIK